MRLPLRDRRERRPRTDSDGSCSTLPRPNTEQANRRRLAYWVPVGPSAAPVALSATAGCPIGAGRPVGAPGGPTGAGRPPLAVPAILPTGPASVKEKARFAERPPSAAR